MVPDVLLISAEWPLRALLRAQLLEEGFDALAVDSWADAERLLLSAGLPWLVAADLVGESEPLHLLTRLKEMLPADRVLVLTAAAILPPDRVRELGFPNVIRRPFEIGDVVAAVARLVAAAHGDGSSRLTSREKG